MSTDDQNVHAQLRAAAETVSRAWDRLIEDDGDDLGPMADAVGQLRAALAAEDADGERR